MKSKIKINNIIGSAVLIAILFTNIAPSVAYAADFYDDYGSIGGFDNYGYSSYGTDNYGYSSGGDSYGYSSYGADNYGYSSGADNYGYSSYGSDNYGYSTPGSDPYGYSSSGGDAYGYSSISSDNYGSTAIGADTYGSTAITSDGYGSTYAGYDNYGSSFNGTDNYGSSYTGVDNYGSSYVGADNYGSSYTGYDNYGTSYTGYDNYGSSYSGYDNYGSSYTGQDNYGTGYATNYGYGSAYSTAGGGYSYSQPTVYSGGQAVQAARSYVSTPSYSYSQPYTYTQPRVAVSYPQTPTYIPTPAPARCSIDINPKVATINKGSGAAISWSSSNTSYVVLSGGVYSNTRVANSGSYTVYPQVNTTYTVICYNSQGLSNSSSAYITVTTPVTPPIFNYCTNGATNYPYCNNNVNNNYCTNGYNNYPYCNNGGVVITTYVYCNGVQYPQGYVCPTTQYNNLTVSTTGATGYTTTATLYGYVNPFNTSALIWFDYGTSQSNLQWQTTKQTTSISGQFSGNLSGLTCGTRYYYRAAAQNSYTTQYGSTLSFVTQACQNNNYGKNTVVTRLATSVGYTTAQLNGAFVSSAYANSCTSFFDYGTTYSLGNRTANQTLSNGSTVSYFSRAISGLTPNTTYYYRAGATCPNGTIYGNIVSFKTPSKKTVVTTYTAPKTEVKATETCLCDTQNYISLVLENLEETAVVGKLANYKLVYKNTSEETLKNVAIRVVLPEEMTMYSAEKGQYTKGGSTLVYTIDSLKSLEGTSFIITTLVDKNTSIGQQMIVNAYANYTVPTIVKDKKALEGEVTAYLISVAGNGTGMNPSNDDTKVSTSTGWTSFLPTTFIDWIIFIIVFLIFVSALRYVFGAFKRSE